MLFPKLESRPGRKDASQTRGSVQPRLEELEDRLTPSGFFAETGTAVTVQLTPNFLANTVTETITAKVTTQPSFDPSTGQSTPVPSGAGTPTGTVLFNLNNQQKSATLDSNGTDSVSFTLPLLSLLSGQTLEVNYQGSFKTDSSGNYSDYGGSSFFGPLYLSYLNLFLPATLTFGQLTPQQQFPTFNSTTMSYNSLPSFGTGQGETDSLGFITFKFTDPGTINTVQIFGLSLPGSFAAAFDAYGPTFSGGTGGI